MICTCCGREGEAMGGGKNVRGEAMYVCDPCKPSAGRCSGKGFHFYSAGDMPKPAVIEKTKKK